MFAYMCGDLHSPELKCLAESIPHRVMEAKAKSILQQSIPVHFLRL